MFKVLRSNKPEDWTGKNYAHPLVVKQLRKDFFSKCYLCEQAYFGNVNVEHFVPHEGKSEELLIEWENLYYSCSHCNGIKGHRDKELLDCCNDQHNVDTSIALEAPSTPSGRVQITNSLPTTSPLYELTNKTISLLEKCYNNSNNGPQQISHEYLVDKIMEHHAKLQTLRFELKKDFYGMTEDRKNEIIELISNMLKPSYQFSAFWKTYVRNDPFLSEILD